MNSNFITATHIMCCLASAQKEGVLGVSPKIARALSINVVVVRKLAALLVNKELVIALSGSGGGYRLAKKAELITLKDIFEAVEEPDADFWGQKKISLKAKMANSTIGSLQSTVESKLAKAKEDMLHSLSLVSLSEIAD